MVAKDKKPNRVIVVVSGGFDPHPHAGHISHMRLAKTLGDYLIAIVNADEFLLRKKGMVNTPLVDRLEQVKAIKYVDEVVVSIDKDQTVAETLKMIKPQIFAKGGDRVPETMPVEELEACKEIGCQIVYNVNGKIRHSKDWYEGLMK
jgi:D-beta-D-heptose 7-phosphate kinase/D-beta-D-heptose 1-phosphate adenosyltransferase